MREIGAWALALGAVFAGGARAEEAVEAFVGALEALGEAQRTPEALLGAKNAPDNAELPRDWAFQPVRAVAPPNVAGLGPIDAFLKEKLAEEGLDFSPRADARTLIRRVYLDVLGLPPSPLEVEAFAADERPGAYAELVDRALASPHYGERWARHWLDVARFGETNGFETNTPRPNAWRYRDWVINALNADMPYDEFVRRQIAGDTLGDDVATGFLVGGPWDEVKSPDIVLTKNQRDGELHDMVSTVGSAVLGLTLGCAKCHDHKFDPVSAREYYRLRACLAGVQHGERELRPPDAEARLAKAEALDAEAAAMHAALQRFAPVASAGGGARPAVSPRGNVERFAPVAATAVRFTITRTTGAEPCIDEIEVFAADDIRRNVALASAGAAATASSEFANSPIHKTAHLNDGKYGNSWSWIPAESGTAWARIDFARAETIDRINWARDRDGAFKDRLATEYVIEALGTDGAWREIASARDRAPLDPATQAEADPCAGVTGDELAACREAAAALKAKQEEAKAMRDFPKAYAGKFDTPAPTHLQYRGDPMMARDEVAPGGADAVLAGFALGGEATDPERRTQLAAWLTDPRNPLTPRVIVNRLWQHHFGRGIVATPGDFGAMGTRPTHPELLDWLAGELLRSGWRLKALHREILLSRAYQQSSAPSAAGLAADAEARLLWRFPPRRLEAEPIRDSILAVSGALDLRMGGPGYDAFKPNNNYVHIYIPKDTFSGDDFRRMIYQFKPRKEQDITFGVFDCPDATQSEAKRNRSTTPLQAMSLLNSPFMQQQAQVFAGRLGREAAADPVGHAFALAFGRVPTAEERAASGAFAREQGLAAFCRAILNANEFLYID